ncbi:MAG: FG-GAP-like repeat-containing protein [Phycisphaerales bacterium]|nr:VCBS repeat-containing protein [Planctomycetota bacterium]MCH8508118.1 FG-GAP-like repeat-containing protein [Phycisphaerales bacterium]
MLCVMSCGVMLLAGALLGPVAAVAAAGPAPVFRLVTHEAGLSNATFIPNAGYPGENAFMAGGVAVGDFNNDGLPDLFVPAGGSGPDKLYINQGDGTFVDEAPLWGVNRWTRAAGVAVGDFNNSGYLDIFVVNYGDFPFPPAVGRCILYENQGPDEHGRWRFVDVAAQAGVHHVFGVVGGMGAAFGDFDLDGRLDLFVSTWIAHPGGNRLFRNNGDGTFANVSQILPPEPSPLRGFTPNFADIDGDGWPDLLLTNDFRTSRLYRNQGTQPDGSFAFENITQAAGISHDCFGMGSVLADLDGDGVLDWFMSDIYRPMSNPPCGNTLYRGLGNDPDGLPRFDNTAAQAGVLDSGWAWGVTAFDANNNGWTDLAVTGGWPAWPSTPTRLYMNRGDGTFADRAAQAGVAWVGQGRGLVHLDYDADGRVDLLIVSNGGQARLYRNETPNPGRFLRIDFDTDAHPCLAPRGVGTRVRVTAGGRTQTQLLDSRTTYLSQSEQTLHFGLGDAEIIDSVEIRWADGSTETLFDVQPDQRIVVPAFHPADFDRNGRFDFFDIAAFLRAFLAGDPAADFNGDGTVSMDDLFAFVQRFLDPCAR